MRWLIMLCLVGCVSDTAKEVHPKDEVWVCHNPKTEYHGSLCTEECYWADYQRESSSFCWLLKSEDCDLPHIYEWQENNCHLLE